MADIKITEENLKLEPLLASGRKKFCIVEVKKVKTLTNTWLLHIKLALQDGVIVNDYLSEFDVYKLQRFCHALSLPYPTQELPDPFECLNKTGLVEVVVGYTANMFKHYVVTDYLFSNQHN